MEYHIFESMIHPIRMRIIQEVLKKKEATVKDISDVLSDIPPASLYRHMKRLVAENILEVAAENKVRGTLEKVYRIKQNPYEEMAKIMETNQPVAIINVFYHFIMSMLSDFQNYFASEDVHPEVDGVGFSMAPLYISRDELIEMATAIREIILKYVNNKPAEDRNLIKLSIISIPDMDQKDG
jgi:DNA-binding transcriptional ArsR family regulator